MGRQSEVEKITELLLANRSSFKSEDADRSVAEIAEILVDNGIRSKDGFEALCGGCCEYEEKDILCVKPIDYKEGNACSGD